MKSEENGRNTENIVDGRKTGNVESTGSGESMEHTEITENSVISVDDIGYLESRKGIRRSGSMGSGWIPENRRQKKKLTGSLAAKIAAFFLFTACVMGAVASGLTVFFLAAEDFYSKDITEIFLDECSGTLLYDILQVRDYITEGDLEAAAEVCEGKNLNIALFQGDLEGDNGSLDSAHNPALIWVAREEEYELELTRDHYVQFSTDYLKGHARVVNHTRLYALRDYVFRAYFNMDFPEDDQYAEIYNGCLFFYKIRYLMLWVFGISFFLGLNSFLFLMCSAGHQNDAEGIQPSVFTSIPLDLYTAVCGIVAAFLLLIMANMGNEIFDHVANLVVFSAVASAEALWCTFYLRELAVRMKLGGWWKNTIVYRVLRLFGRLIRLFWRGVCAVLREIPSILGTLIFFLGFAIAEFFGMLLCGAEAEMVSLWAVEKMVVCPLVAYIAIMCKRLLAGSRTLAEGRSEEIIDTRHMYGDFKECGENLNNIGQGISRAVAERMKSEHLKTELITNVTHDIKTPLTSIINYANLIAQEPVENAKITEYSEVLVRQSGRLKKLLEDLLEASKATTGNLEVNLQPCEVSVILSQAIGEYQQRMEEKQLELIVTQPEQPVNIMADGRHLWRVFDNLLNNICKYAREDSRVYLSVEVVEKNVSIIFRNMSKYALNITAEELQERFVRGDRSRHMEGNGLGLSIAKSLTELQNGQMEIVTDGDLFKVCVYFREQ
ncbi:MAG: sensor histidine kinase [Lachnospiraceae bacterium]|nr:sensor histidine kinase [Lachnospiraceae bacterium]MCM1240682.1 sensor histidine kinase [Lachnospiraceae bacterium]